MALPDLSGSLIQNTYQRVLHTDGAAIFDGTGSAVLSQMELQSLQEIGSSNITSTEWAQIAAIGSANITAAEWSYLAGVTNVNWDNLATIEQNLGNDSTVQFAKINTSITIDAGDSPSFANASGRAGLAFQNLTATSSMYILFNRNEAPIEFRHGGHISMSGQLTSSAIKLQPQGATDNLLETYQSNGVGPLSYIAADGTFQGAAASATLATNATNATNIIAGSNAEDEEQFIAFLDNGNTTAQGIKYDGGIKYNPSKDRLTLSGGITGSDISASGDIAAATFVGNIDAVDGDFDGTLEADAITIGGTSLSDVITATVVDNATLAGSVTVVNSTADAETPVVFHNEINGLRDDTGTFTYNAADGRLTVPDINSSNVTASGNISSSGNVYSTNTETIQYSFQLQNGANVNTWYGPNSQGPNYYYWNRDYSAYPHTGIVYLNSGHHLQHKAELVSAKFILTGLTKPFIGAAVTASVVVKPKTDLSQAGGGFTYPLTSADNNNLFENGLSANFVNTMSVVYGMYEIQCPVSGAFDADSILYPRIRLGAPYTGSGNFRGMWQLEYRRIK